MAQEAPHAAPKAESWFGASTLRGRCALVTGGGSGIGLAIARLLASQGANVCLLGRRQAVLDEAVADLCRSLASEQFVFGVSADVRDLADLTSAIEAAGQRFGGRLDILVCSAAGNFIAAAQHLSARAFRAVVEIDLVGTFQAARLAFPLLRRAVSAAGSASVVNITALPDELGWYQAHAAAAKAGINALTRSLALEWGPLGIRVNAVAPGPIADTEGFRRLSGNAQDNPDALKLMTGHIPLARFGEGLDVAQAVLFFCQQTWTTGQILAVDGGASLSRARVISPEIYELIRQQRSKL